MMKDFFCKPIKVVIASGIRPGDYIHDISDPASLLDIEKRKGFVVSVASTGWRRTALRLDGRRTLLDVPASAYAAITQASGSALQLRPDKPPLKPSAEHPATSIEERHHA